ncbi:MAG TPA: hypothetical protein VGQ07_02230 [Nitrospirales bacterium]|jgi:hypothetical protein|nr:hypothetical protein [Nitrospirales bacterium]
MDLCLAALTIAWAVGVSPAAGEPSRPLVGHVMALLATFEQADVLPPENSPEANALVHALIQTQAALTKSTNQATRKWFTDALRRGASPGTTLSPHDGLTSRTLEAILAYAATDPPADRPDVLAGLMEFNVSQADLDRLTRVYGQARDRFRTAAQDIHRVYEAQRQTMPFR